MVIPEQQDEEPIEDNLLDLTFDDVSFFGWKSLMNIDFSFFFLKNDADKVNESLVWSFQDDEANKTISHERNLIEEK